MPIPADVDAEDAIIDGEIVVLDVSVVAASVQDPAIEMTSNSRRNQEEVAQPNMSSLSSSPSHLSRSVVKGRYRPDPKLAR